MTNKASGAAKPLNIYIIAGEASGDLIGAHLMRAITRQSNVPVRFFGIGGSKMIAEGIKSLFPNYELSMLGFVEILPYVFNTLARVHHTVDDIMAKHPDIVITIDCPGFCFRVVEKLRNEKLKSKFVHYVAPTVWAYKPKRALLCAKLFDHMLTLLPFEAPYFEDVGLKCTWVGHPVVAETQVGNGMNFRNKYEIKAKTPLFCLLPGSRKSEVERHMPIFGKAIGMLATQFPDLAMAVAVPANVMPYVAPFFESCPFRAVVMANEQDKKDAIAASNLAIVKSGTIALEVAMAGTPMLVTYRVHPISAWCFKRIRLINYVNIVNILENKEIIPELLQELCTPLMIASASAALLTQTARQQEQKNIQKQSLEKLILPGGDLPSDKAAQTVLKLL